MTKVVFVANQYFPHIVGGAEIVMQTLVEELSRRGVDVVVITLSITGDDTQDTVNGVRVYRVAITNLYRPSSGKQTPLNKLAWHLLDLRNRGMARKVGVILDMERPSVLATHNISGFSTSIWRQAKTRNVRVVHTLHDYYLLCPRTTMFKQGRSCGEQCVFCACLSAPKKTASSSVDIVVGVSKFVLKEHLDRGYFPDARAHVIYNARERNASAGDIVARQDSGSLTVGFIGRVEAEKGIEVLLGAAKSLPKSVKILVAGKATDPDYIKDLRSRYASHDVEYLGFVRPEDFYAAIDLLVVPSLWNEPLPTVVFEAMGYGVPVIGSSLGGIPELLEDSNTGWLFKAGSAEDLGSLLSSIARAPQRLQDMRGACVTRRERYVPERMADEYLALMTATV